MEASSAVIQSGQIAADSHSGLIRECNEDNFVYSVQPDHKNVFAAVADGIGGHDSGDVASQICMEEMLLYWRKSAYPNTNSSNRLKTFLDKAIKHSNQRIFNLNSSFDIAHPMGTTVVCGVFHPEFLVVAHAGDSRCYRLRNGLLDKITNDHSYISELIRAKAISPEEAKFHPLAHIISRSVGPVEHLEPETHVHERKPRDRYLFCTDGLTTHVEDIEIEMILYDATNPRDATRNLLYSALRYGGEDNITVLCVFT